MGKAVPKSIKMRAEAMLERFPEKFDNNFERNKEAINKFGFPFSKFDRNMIAGFITRTINEKKQAAMRLVAKAEAKEKPAENTEAKDAA